MSARNKATNPPISCSQCNDEWLIGAIINLSWEREDVSSPRILKLYSDKIQEVKRTTKLLRCKAEAKLSWDVDVLLEYHYEIDRDGDAFIGYNIGDPVAMPGATLDDAYGLGEVMTGSDGTQIRVLHTIADAWPLIRAESQFNDPPRQGNRFVMIRIEVANPSDALHSIGVNHTDFGLIGSKRVMYTYSDSPALLPDQLNREIFPGGCAEGNVCFEVGSDESGLILIHKALHGTENRRFLRVTD